MIRMPDGIGGQRFYQRIPSGQPGFAESLTLYSGSKDESHEYLLCNNLPTLLWLAQSGTLEFHVWHSACSLRPTAPARAPTMPRRSREALEGSVLNYPDYVVFDIDPYIYSGKEKPGESRS